MGNKIENRHELPTDYEFLKVKNWKRLHAECNIKWGQSQVLFLHNFPTIGCELLESTHDALSQMPQIISYPYDRANR
jgi:hypothetical protein